MLGSMLVVASVLGAPSSEIAPSAVPPPSKGRALVPQAQQEAPPPIIDAHDPMYEKTWAYPAVDLVGLEHPVLDHFASLHTELNIFMWGDSTVEAQFSLLCELTVGAPCSTPAFQQVAVSMPQEKLRANAALCDAVEVFIHNGTIGNATISLTAAVCRQGVASVAMVPNLLETLQQEPYKVTLPADSLLYIGGAALHHLHNEDLSKVASQNRCNCVRDWLTMKPLVEAYEENMKYGLTELQKRFPEAKLAYFNAHSLCNGLFTFFGNTRRANACESHDWKACFSGVDVPAEERDSFCGSLMSHHGSDVMAARERAVLSDPSLKWTLVDGHQITKDASCDQTGDGVHYSKETVMKEIEDALTVLRRDRRP